MHHCARTRVRAVPTLCILAVFLLFSYGCSLLSTQRQTRLRTDEGYLIVERLASDRAKVRTLRSFARLMLVSEGRAYRASVAVLLERPGRFRIEFLGPFRHPRHVVAFDGKMFSEIGKNNEIRLLNADVSGSTLSFLGLTPQWLVSAILGLPPISQDSIVVDGAFREAKNKVRLELNDGRADMTLWVRQRSGRQDVEKAVFNPRFGGEPVVEMLYSDFRAITGQDSVHCKLPRIVTIAVPERRESLRIILSEPELNARVDPALFRIAP